VRSGTFEPAFFGPSCVLGLGFFAVLVIRIWLHLQDDKIWAQAVGGAVLSLTDATIWLMSVWLFRSLSPTASVLIYGFYCVAIVMYPTVLMLRSLDFRSRAVLLLVAVASTAATPVWVASLSQTEFLVTNVASLSIGAFFAESLSASRRELEFMRHKEVNAARSTAAADSKLNHVVKNRFLVIKHRIDQARTELNIGGLRSVDQMRTWLEEADTALQTCVTWLHDREFFIQLSHGSYQTSLRHVHMLDLLRRCSTMVPQVVVRLDCAPALCTDDVAISLCLEEAMSNARKYGDTSEPVLLAASTSKRDRQLVLSVDTVNPLGAIRLSDGELTRAFEDGFKGRAASGMSRSDGVGLAAAREAARAAHGSAVLLTREDENSRVHTIFELRVPYEEAQPAEGPPSGTPAASPKQVGEAVPSAAVPEEASPARTQQDGGTQHRPLCIVVDDDPFVEIAVVEQVASRMPEFDVAAFGSTFESQEWMEDVILGVRSFRDTEAVLPPPHRAANVAVIDMHLALAPPGPPPPS
jgi:two-component sensor histidine kinase